MAQWHLDELENKIQQTGWIIISQLQEEEHKAIWVIKRKSIQYIDFSCFDTMGYPVPLQESFGCQIRETKVNLYFYKKGENWKNNLSEFISKLNNLD
ncbi:MAG: hypothetical protein IPJ81_11715 [Chitinophagaceae bacterium]|nr:hypothetical protein [Chitinophagaceae bacterium]